MDINEIVTYVGDSLTIDIPSTNDDGSITLVSTDVTNMKCVIVDKNGANYLVMFKGLPVKFNVSEGDLSE